MAARGASLQATLRGLRRDTDFTRDEAAARPEDLATNRLVSALKKAFGTVAPIWYLEDGFQTTGGAPLYAGPETEKHPVSEQEQAAQLTAAVTLAYCQPGVTGFFNFELRDDASLDGWQSGLLRPDWSAKPAFVAYVQAIAAAKDGKIQCGEARR